MKPLQRGQETDLVEIPASWYLDDLPPMMFIKAAPNSHGFVSPARTSRTSGATSSTGSTASTTTRCSPLTIHPDVSGKPQVLMMHERLFEHISGHPGVKFTTFEEIADDFAKRYPRKREARPQS